MTIKKMSTKKTSTGTTKLIEMIFLNFIFSLFCLGEVHWLLASTVLHSVQYNEGENRPFNGPQGEAVFKGLWVSLYGAGEVPPMPQIPQTPLVREETTATVVPTPPTLTPAPASIPTLSKGEQYVQDALKKNREKLQELRAKEKQGQTNNGTDGNDQNEVNGEDTGSFLDEAKRSVAQTHQEWKNDTEKTYKRWREERDDFLAHIEDYKKGLVPLPVPVSEFSKKVTKRDLVAAVNPQTLVSVTKSEQKSEQKLETKKSVPLPYTIVSGALDFPVKDQGKRSTCSAFALVRAMEILMRQHLRMEQLSEQYFYWASRPDCQESPCSKRGSWVISGLLYGKNRASADIPMAEMCPYKSESVLNNDTQTPLLSGCLKNGRARVVQYSEVTTLDQVMMALKKNQPVVIGTRLSENFYTNEGFVTDTPNGTSGKHFDEHALGHAMLLVGYIELPPKYRAKQGSVCFVVANSWGEGFGMGGHSCLSERWLQHYRSLNPFVAIESIEVL